MPSPVYSAGSPGNVFSNSALATGKNIAVFLDLSTDIEGHVTYELVTGTTAPAVSTVVFAAYNAHAAGGAAPITLSGSVSGTSVPVNATTNLNGVHVGQTLALINHTTGVGELVQMSTTAPSGTGAQSLSLATAPVGTYGANDLIYLMASAPIFPVSPANPSTGAVAASTDYSVEVVLGPSQYIVVATNGSSQTVGVFATVDKITAIQ